MPVEQKAVVAILGQVEKGEDGKINYGDQDRAVPLPFMDARVWDWLDS
jgi:hypothetical protein